MPKPEARKIKRTDKICLFTPLQGALLITLTLLRLCNTDTYSRSADTQSEHSLLKANAEPQAVIRQSPHVGFRLKFENPVHCLGSVLASMHYLPHMAVPRCC